MSGTIYRNSVQVDDAAEAYTLSTYNKLASCVVGATTSATPNIDYTASEGSALGPNGKIYCVSYSASTNYTPFVISITESGIEYEKLSLTSVTPESWRGVGAVLAPNGKIYCIPAEDTRIITIDTKTHEIATAVTGIATGAYKGGVLHPNGKIYCIPRGATHVGILDPSNNTLDTTSITAPSGGNKYFGGVLAPNGKIYCTPHHDENHVGIIDVVAETLDTTTISITTGSDKYCFGVLAHNGKIYCPPRDATTVLIVDTATDTAEETSITGLTGSDKYGASRLAPDGKIYCCPSSATHVLIIDPETDSADVTTISGLDSDPNKWHCMSLAPDGKIYCPPGGNYADVLIINPGLAKYPITPLLSPYLNG